MNGETYPVHPGLMFRFWKRVIKLGDTECWNWTASISGGYGQINAGGSGPMLRTHRVSWLIHRGPIPEGVHVLHDCDNRRCVNPAHLFLGDRFDNMSGCVARGRHGGPIGEQVFSAKLNPEKVRQIRVTYVEAHGRIGIVNELASLYGVSRDNIGDIVRRRTWKHVA